MGLNMKLISSGTGGEMQLVGRLDNSTAPEAEQSLLDAVGQFDSLVLDLKQLEYVSSAGLRALKRAHIAMHRKDGAFTIKNANQAVMEVFEITGFAGLLNII